MAELTNEQIIQALEKETAELQKQLAKRDTTIASQANEITSLKSTVAEKVEAIRNLEGEADATEKIVAGYETQLKAAKAQGEGGKPVVTLDGKHYRVLAPRFQHEGQSIDAAELAKNPELVAELVASGTPLLKLVD